MVAFLKTLKSPAVFKTESDDSDQSGRLRSRSATISIRLKILPMRAVDKAGFGNKHRVHRSSWDTCHSDRDSRSKLGPHRCQNGSLGRTRR